jgi:beta-ureidopropionase / N-carbamoyl-L-amino-acid hydrolase
MHIPINRDRLLDDLFTLATFTEPGTPGWTRRFPSDAYRRGRDWLRERMQAAGLRTSQDAAGNLFGRLGGPGPAIVSGSHTDTVMGAGRYDGMFGVLGALEAARSIQEAGITLKHPFVVADYLAEEATDYGMACMGSMIAVTRDFKPEFLDRTVSGKTLREAIREMGGTPDHMPSPLFHPGEVAAHFELHIEQGPVLEARGVRLAAVNGIVGIRRAIFELGGTSNHAGATPMDLRHDAIAVLGQLIVKIEEIARRNAPNGNGAVGTIGKIDVRPNQANVIANHVTTVPELRSLDMTELDAMWTEFMAFARQVCDERGVSLQLVNETRMLSVLPPDALHTLVREVCRSLYPGAIVTPSGAGHDSNYLGLIAPTHMIFVPSRGGRSHAPEEHTEPDDLALGVQALTACIIAADNALPFDV